MTTPLFKCTVDCPECGALMSLPALEGHRDVIRFDATELRIHIAEHHRDTPTPEPLPPYVDVKGYLTDTGRRSWVFRCWGDGDCDGALHLDLGNGAYAERKAREHVAEAHTPTPAP